MIVTIKHGIHLFKGAWLDVFVHIAIFEQMFCILNHKQRRCTKLTGLHLHAGGTQAKLRTNFVQVKGFGFAALTDNEYAVTGLTSACFARKLRSLPHFGLVIFSHVFAYQLATRVDGMGSLKNGTAP